MHDSLSQVRNTLFLSNSTFNDLAIMNSFLEWNMIAKIKLDFASEKECYSVLLKMMKKEVKLKLKRV